MNTFNIGDIIIIDERYSNSSWYHPNEMRIIGIDAENENLLAVDFNFKIYTDEGDKLDNHVHYANVKLIKNSIRVERLEKINKLFNNENSTN